MILSYWQRRGGEFVKRSWRAGWTFLIGSALYLQASMLAASEQGYQQRNDAQQQLFRSPLFVQLQLGLASDADFGPSLFFIADPSRERTSLASLSVGRRLATRLWRWQADVVGYVGVQNYHERGRQPDSYGLTLYWKAYRQWWPDWLGMPLRFGLGQGLSYASRIPVAEQRDFEPRQSAELVHYLEWTLQLPLTGLLRVAGFETGLDPEKWWFGYSIFHRSTVFGLFADAPGGVNYPGLTFEYVLY